MIRRSAHGEVFDADGNRVGRVGSASITVADHDVPIAGASVADVRPGTETREGTIRFQQIDTRWEEAVTAHAEGFRTAFAQLGAQAEVAAARMRELAASWEPVIRSALDIAARYEAAERPVLLPGPKVRWGFPDVDDRAWRTRADAIRGRPKPWWMRWTLDGVTVGDDGSFG